MSSLYAGLPPLRGHAASGGVRKDCATYICRLAAVSARSKYNSACVRRRVVGAMWLPAGRVQCHVPAETRGGEGSRSRVTRPHPPTTKLRTDPRSPSVFWSIVQYIQLRYYPPHLPHPHPTPTACSLRWGRVLAQKNTSLITTTTTTSSSSSCYIPASTLPHPQRIKKK